VTSGSEVNSVSLLAPRFISDLHLSQDQPRTLEGFLSLAGQLAGGELLILGDLFEIWAGDEEMADGIGATVATALQGARDRGTAIYLMAGNRDRLMGKRFAAAAGAVMLADPCHTVLDGVPTLLAHGDAYCTRDRGYIAWRRASTNPILRFLFLSFPLAQRRRMLGQVRQRSESGKKTMAADIMDVTPEAIGDALRRGGARRMIHGHTHRPDFHRFSLDGQPAERWVLPDWDLDGPVPRGGYLRLSEGRPELVPV
jgi:UDP-2,3-diacylglucosamine hydrolase